MVTRSPRSRSTTSATASATSQHRPISRQSTTSIQSNGTQPAASHHNNHSFQAMQMPSTMWDHHQHAMAQSQQHQLHNQGGQYMVDNSLHSHGHGPFGQDATSFQNGPSMHMRPPSQATLLDGKENVSFDVGMDSSTIADNGTDSSKRKKGSASSQANDNELRRLFRENEGRDLHEVAQQVIHDEKGPKSEKTKQIFGMLWLHTHTKRSSTSVPRNRVFSSYATRCGTERVPPLNPASFGKLVRIIFPGITTRRLGVRGESKYHYVELALIDDNRPERASVSRGRSMTVDLQRESVGPAIESSKQQMPADTADFGPSHSPKRPTRGRNSNLTTSRLYPLISNSNERSTEISSMISRPLQFSSLSQEPLLPGEAQLDLPSIEPYLPAGTDSDAVDSLTSVYRSHCLLAIDNFRYCKTDKLCDSYKSLVGLLTVPGQKLLAHPNISAWIRACDWMKYQKMIPMLDMILLTQVPKKAMTHMENVSNNICNWITQFFQNQPQHTQNAMLGPTNIFASLLERFLRVNRAALDVAQVLETTEDRDALWEDWVAHVKPQHILQNSLLDHGHRRVLHILTQEVRFLLSPLEAMAELKNPLFSDNGVKSDFQLSEASPKNTGSSSSIIARLSRFLGSLASRFPGVGTRELLSHIDVIGGNISRNLTLNGASSLGNWWRIKLFIDEMSYWLSEKGGFLYTTPDGLDAAITVQKANRNGPALLNLHPGSNQSSTRSSTSTAGRRLQPRQSPSFGDTNGNVQTHSFDKETQHQSHNQKGQVVEPKQDPDSRSGSTVVDEDDGMGFGDDSGIAMNLDDDFGIESKYNTFVEGVHGSDPADVVVC